MEIRRTVTALRQCCLINKSPMETREERIAEAKIMLKAMGLTPQDLLENVEKQETIPQFLDIQKINDVPYIYLYYDDKINKGIWMCLEIPDNPMTWNKGRKWCQSKGGDYAELKTLRFVSKRRLGINKVLEVNGYPLIEKEWYWSTEFDNKNSRVLNMTYGNNDHDNQTNYNYVRCVVYK